MLRSNVFAPDAPKAEKKSLIWSVAVDRLPRFLVLGYQLVQSHERDAGTAIIGGVLAQSQLAIQLEVANGGEAAVFISYATCALFEFSGVCCCPPIAQIAFGIVLAPFIIEAVSQFMPDHEA